MPYIPQPSAVQLPPRSGHFGNKTPSQIATEWYTADEVYRGIAMQRSVPGALPSIPRDVTSREFAEWLTDQYRMAMAKGIQLGRGTE